jgi:hypothetical protein
MKTLSLLLFFTLSLNYGFSCDCAYQKTITHNEIKSLTNIFIGIVDSIEYDTETNLNKVVFSVLKDYKNDNGNTSKVIWTMPYESACGVTFKIGQKWFITTRNSNSNSYKTSISLCDRTKNFTEPKLFQQIDDKLVRRSKKNWREEKRHYKKDIRIIEKYFQTTTLTN